MFTRGLLTLSLLASLLTSFASAITITSDTVLDASSEQFARYTVQSGTLTVNDGARITSIDVRSGGQLIMNGGLVTDEIDSRNAIISGGTIGRIYVKGETTISGGVVSGPVSTYGNLTLNGGVIGALHPLAGEIVMNGGKIAGGIRLNDYDPQVMTIWGGMPIAIALDKSEISTGLAYTFNIHGGQFVRDAVKNTAGTDSVANIYGTQLRKFDGPGVDREGRPITVKRVTGILADGTWFRAASPVDWFVLHNSEPLSPTVLGDANYDGRVDISDLNMIRNNFGSYAQGDMDGSGEVGIDDLNMVRNNFGFSDAQAVPEPSGFVLMALALASLSGTPLRCRCSRWLRRYI